jgi:hypothetical protein
MGGDISIFFERCGLAWLGCSGASGDAVRIFGYRYRYDVEAALRRHLAS